MSCDKVTNELLVSPATFCLGMPKAFRKLKINNKFEVGVGGTVK